MIRRHRRARARARLVTAPGFAIAAATVALAVGCTPVETSNGQPPINNGQPESGYPAVGVLVSDGQARCTGTLIAPDAVLTAAHCVDGVEPSGLSFVIGADSSAAPGTPHGVARAIAHPLYTADASGVRAFDIAVLLLGAQTPQAPMTYNREDVIGFAGQNVLLVSYGASAAASESGQQAAPQKQSSTMPIVSVSEQFLDFTSPDGKTGCLGDTGGPAVLQLRGQPTVIGVTSWGATECTGSFHYTRTDVFADFVAKAVLGQVDDRPSPDAGMEEPVDGGGEEPPTEEPPTEEPPPEEPPPEGDFCEENGWYGDGICDDCPLPDPDCF